MSRRDKEMTMKRLVAILKALFGALAGFAFGLLIIMGCAFLDYVPESMAGYYALMYSPAILALLSAIFVFSEDMYLFRKEW